MELYILNTERKTIGHIDDYESLIWTLRYYEPGDFEIYTRASEQALSLLQLDNYVVRTGSDMVGIIESVKIESDPEDGDHIVATGRDLKSILDRRIIWSMTNVSGTVENCIRSLITANAVSPTLAYRAIPNLVLGTAKGFTETMEAQFTGDNLLEVVVNLCKQYEYGFKIILNANKNFEFQLYKGTNRSYNQVGNPFVVFAPEFENIVSSDYVHNKVTLKNACNVAGEGEGTARKMYGVGSTSGLARREMFVDARDISSAQEDETTLTTEEYNNLLIQRGREKLAENVETITFEGEVESVRQFVFDRDYFLGDIVTVKNSYGVIAHPRVIEVIQSHDENGFSTIPAFSIMEVYE